MSRPSAHPLPIRYSSGHPIPTQTPFPAQPDSNDYSNPSWSMLSHSRLTCSLANRQPHSEPEQQEKAK